MAISTLSVALFGRWTGAMPLTARRESLRFSARCPILGSSADAGLEMDPNDPAPFLGRRVLQLRQEPKLRIHVNRARKPARRGIGNS